MLGRKRGRDQNVFPAKRRQRFLVEEVKYDPQARQEYLTGFHKRKLQRQKHAQETAAMKEKEERRRQRAEVRAERQAHIDRHMAALNGTVLEEAEPHRTSEGEESGGSSNKGDALQREAPDRETEYDDEERTATVTVQAVDVTRQGLEPQEDHMTAIESLQSKREDVSHPSAQAKHRGASEQANKVKRKKKKFRYESKAENKLNRAKERAAGKAKAKSRK